MRTMVRWGWGETGDDDVGAVSALPDRQSTERRGRAESRETMRTMVRWGVGSKYFISMVWRR